jgi:hypothetical protein
MGSLSAAYNNLIIITLPGKSRKKERLWSEFAEFIKDDDHVRGKGPVDTAVRHPAAGDC